MRSEGVGGLRLHKSRTGFEPYPSEAKRQQTALHEPITGSSPTSISTQKIDSRDHLAIARPEGEGAAKAQNHEDLFARHPERTAATRCRNATPNPYFASAAGGCANASHSAASASRPGRSPAITQNPYRTSSVSPFFTSSRKNAPNRP